MKKYLAIILSALLLTLGGAWGANKVLAMASISMAATKTATATTTLAYLQVGISTTTVNVPTPLSLGVSTKYDKAYVMFEVQSTTSPGRINIRVEHSLDGIDWFSELVQPQAVATTSSLYAQELLFSMATSSGYINNGGITRVHGGVYVDTPTPYNRVVFYMPNTQTTGNPSLGLWAAVQPIKEVQVINQ